MSRIFGTCFLCIASLFCAAAQGEATAAPSKPEALDVYYEAVRKFLAVLPGEYDPEKATKPPSWGRIGPLPSVALRVGKGGPFMQLDARDGTVYFFDDSSPLYKGEGAEEPIDSVLSADEAFALALPVLQHYGLATERDEYEVTPDRSVPNTVGQGRWKISKDLAWGEMETLNSRVRVLVRAYTKRVEVVKYSPPIPPAPVDHGISRAEAIERAREVVQRQKDWPFAEARNLEFGQPAEVTKIVAMPWEYRNLRPHEHPYHSRYFWKVPFIGEFRDADAESWQRLWTYELIDVETGQGILEVTAP